MKIKWLHVVRDIAAVWGVTFIGGFLTTKALGRLPTFGELWVIGLILNTLAFCFVGCLTLKHRWRHLWLVAIGSWLTSVFINVYLPNAGNWGYGKMRAFFVGLACGAGLLIFVTMGLGGAMSFVFRPSKESPAEATPEEPADAKTGG